jgi:CheY-like chemotaxis protein
MPIESEAGERSDVTRAENAPLRSIPRAAQCRPSEGASFVAMVRSIDATGVFIEAVGHSLAYMDIVSLTLLGDSGPLLELSAKVVSVVRAKGARLELTADSAETTVEAFKAWAEGRPVAGGAARSSSASESPPPPPSELAPRANGSRPSLSGLRVLVVDDDPLVLSALRRVLIQLGCDVEVTQDPPTALELLYRKPVDVVLLDWMLPKIPGQDMLAELRTSYKNVAVAIVSGALWWDGADDYLRSLGATTVIHKPLGVEDIAGWLSTIRRAPPASAPVNP